MVRITEKLIRKRSEHNELVIGTLEELSLHQEDIEQIEHIDRWCRDLKILLLQSNLIAKIENLHMLKKLEYLNLAVNNIERIENLAGLESLQKLDLTLNFIGELTTVESLKGNYNLRELYLTGNPCTDFPGYRDYVICALPQIDTLDGQEISRTDRLNAYKHFQENHSRIIQLEIKYKIERDEQKVRVNQLIHEQENSMKEMDEEERTARFWQQKSEHCPETRILMAKYSKRSNEKCGLDLVDPVRVKKRTLFAECGRPYSLNEPKIKFDFRDEDDRYEVNMHIYRYLDSSCIQVDVQPNYVRATIKGKVFQLALKDEVKTDSSSCQRSSITGHLLVIMPKLNQHDMTFKPSKHEGTPCQLDTSEKVNDLKGSVNYKNIIQKNLKASKNHVDENEIPPLI
ncbi:protein tilB isoform X2 [Topomyia yanbarensis]|uniref:protein tilB isoform X2 n=1 Tax=Topomyia yanbarensis TaxID=2498891 RepID=UPI00273B23D0|nr:protein tilB isoform X2 [Topomyia yanbarensis]